MDDRPLPRWVWAFILVGAGFFILALLVSAIFDPTIRLLHTLQALIYIAVIVLARRNSAWGFGVGFTISLLWNYTNLFVTTFFAAGFHRLSVLLHTGRLERPDLLISLVAGGGHVLLLAGCLAGFLRLRPGPRHWAQFVAGGVVAVLYFVAIIITTGPQYIPLIKRVFHIAGLLGGRGPSHSELPPTLCEPFADSIADCCRRQTPFLAPHAAGLPRSLRTRARSWTAAGC